MKFKYFIAMATAALVMTNCSKEESLVNEEPAGLNQIIATVEGKDARSTTNDAGVFKWSVGDQLKVIDKSNSQSYYQYGESGTFSLVQGQGITDRALYAAYPANKETSDYDVKFDVTDDQSGVRTVEYPSVLGSTSEEYKENTNAMMLAKVDPSNLSVLNFKHLGGVMRFTIQDVPVGCKYFEFTATNKRINGKFKLSSLEKESGEGDLKTTEDGVYYVETVDAEYGNTSKRNFKATTSVQTMTFYVPLPVGEYGEFSIKLGFDGDVDAVTKEYTNVTKKINRRTLMMMPALKVVESGESSGSYSIENATEDGASEVTLLEDGQQLNVNGSNESVTVNVPDGTDATAVLVMNINPDDGNARFTISDGSEDNATSTESKATVNVNAGAATVGTLNINAPSLTVNLASGIYTSVTAKTATNTLVIEGGVTVHTLEVKGGNVVLKPGATISTITRGTDAEKIYVLVESGATAPTDITDKNVVVLQMNAEGEVEVSTFDALKKAVGCPAPIKLTAGIEASEVIELGSDVTIKGNGQTITSSATRVFRLTASNIKVAMENLKVVSGVTSGDDIRGISLDTDLTGIELSLNNCSVDFNEAIEDKGAYAVNVGGGTAYTLNISGGEYEGANVINVWGDNHTITIDGAELTSFYQPSESFIGACIRLEGTGVNLAVKNTTFNGDQAVAISEAKDGNTVSEEDNTDNTKFYVAKIGSTYFYTLNEAAASTAEGDIILYRNTALTADLTVSKAICVPAGKAVTVELGSYDVTATQSDAFEVQGTLIINAEDDAEIKAGTVKENTGSVCAVWAHNGGKVTINGGHYIVYEDKNGDRNDCIYAGSNAKGTAGTITINGGKFEYGSETGTETAKNGHLFLLNCADSQLTSSITVNGGLFKNHVPSKEPNGTDEVALGSGKAVYKQNGGEQVTTAYSGTEAVWYEVK